MMNTSVGSTIEKIKLLEQNKEAKLKEKREYEGALSSLNRAVKEATSQIEVYDQKKLELTQKIEKLRPILEKEKIRRFALLAQLDRSRRMLEDLKTLSEDGIAKVWNLRSSLCNTVQNVSDQYDLWALLMRPVCTDLLPEVPVMNPNNNEPFLANVERLKAALERRRKAEEDRLILLTEQDTGKEFVRIRNALNFSMKKIAELQKKES